MVLIKLAIDKPEWDQLGDDKKSILVLNVCETKYSSMLIYAR